MSRIGIVVAPLICLLSFASSVVAEEAKRVSLSPTSDGVEVRVGEQVVATYVSRDAKLKRPFFKNLKTPGGIAVTRGNPLVKGQDPEDHGDIHPGLWMAFGDIGGHDFWRNKGPRVEQEQLTVGDDGSSFAVVNRYVDGDVVICRERTTFTFTPRAAGYVIGWDTTIEPQAAGLFFGEQEEMGLGVRVATPIKVKQGTGRIVNSAGGENEKGTWGNVAEWCDYAGTIDGRHVGVTLMADPGNANKTWFHSRDYGALVANAFGARARAPAKLPLEQGKTLRLRYGVLVHDTATPGDVDLAAEYKAFAGGAVPAAAAVASADANAAAVVAAAAEPAKPAAAEDGKTTPAPAEPEGMKPIFDGKTLDGWDGNPKLWSVKDGAIRGETTAENPTKGNTFIIWKGGTVKDFELRLSFRVSDTNNSGIQYRSEHLADRKDNDWVVKGYQAEVRVDKETPGFIYDEKGDGKRGRMCLVGEKAVWENGKKNVTGSVGDKDAIRAALKPDGWNEYVIIARGNHIQHFINGVQTIDFTDKDPQLALTEGILALQLHAGKPMWVEFKDVRLKQF